jgi:glucosamine--fructose-6-phosphate aminotransferase (isomerizing)
MIEEIFEQPEALERTLADGRAHALRFREFARRKEFRLIVLVARGTSDNAALFGRYLFELTTGIPVSLCAPSIHTLYRARLDLRQALVIGISQSGESTDINLVVQAARRQGAFTLAVTNEAGSRMARMADEVFLVRAGRQRTVAATKTYTGQLMALYLLASALGEQITLREVARIPQYVARALRLRKQVAALVEEYRAMRSCVVVARGLNYANAFELSLKLMETCYVLAERFSSADFLHGPIAMIERGFPVILFLPPGRVFADLSRLAVRLDRLGARTLLISSDGVRLPVASPFIRIPCRLPELFTPIPYIIPGQLFAAALAEAKGLDPDRPRELQIVTKTI